MKTKGIYDLISCGSINIPLFLCRNLKNLKLDYESLFFLMYLKGLGDNSIFDPNKYSSDLGIEINKVLELIAKLSSLSLIEIKASKNDSGMMEEVVSLKLFYNKVVKLLIESEEEVESSNIYDTIQKEFGRVLSPIEYEIIGAWIDSSYSEELILEALKEAVYNGVTNLRYIDKILYEWNKKGYKNKSDVDKDRDKWKNKDNKISSNKPKKEVFDYNWLEDDNDE